MCRLYHLKIVFPVYLLCLLAALPSLAAKLGGYVLPHRANMVPAELYAAAPDIFEEISDADPTYKNPCFWSASAELKCLPYFMMLGASMLCCPITLILTALLIFSGNLSSRVEIGMHSLTGVPKAATTDLYAKLLGVPQVVGGNLKEPHFWYELPVCSSATDISLRPGNMILCLIIDLSLSKYTKVYSFKICLRRSEYSFSLLY